MKFLLTLLLLSLSLNVYASKQDLVVHIAKENKISIKQADLIVSEVYKQSRSKKVDPEFVLAIIQKESNFNQNSVNGKSVGLMQINTAYHKKLLNAKPKEIAANINAGITILLSCKGDTSKVLTCYHGKYNTAYISYITAKKKLFKQLLRK